MVEKFTLEDGSPARQFESVQQMDEIMIVRWNEVVRPSDHVWHLGDVAMRKDVMDRVLPRLLGHKRLIRGNHDTFKTQSYLPHFEEIRGVSVLNRLLFTHIPVHPSCLGRFTANVHGHTHHRRLSPTTITDQQGYAGPDRVVPYLNLCVEQTNYRPVSLEEVSAWAAAGRQPLIVGRRP